MPSKTAAQIGADLAKAIEQDIKAIPLDIARNLRVKPPLGTPVQTGHARRNWIPSSGEPHSGEVDSDGDYEAGLAAALAWKLGDGALWVSNSVPYIQALNDGHSKKSPAGFVERAIDMALQKAQQRSQARVDVTALRAGFQSAAGEAYAENLAAAYSPFGDDE